MTRTRIESLLASFPKLIPTNTQHTSVETPEVRYVYQPLEDLYILLITNKASNILQDIDTLHLFARVVSDLCRSADEREILKNAFELLGAFDEIVSMGYREQVNLMQVRSVLEMESHEEKIQEIIARVRWPARCHLFALFNVVPFRRIKKQRRKKNLSAVPNSWKYSVGNNNGALLVAVVAVGAISVVESQATPLFLDLKPQIYLHHPLHVSLPPHLPHQPVAQPSRAVA
jgi:hypothetical protein